MTPRFIGLVSLLSVMGVAVAEAQPSSTPGPTREQIREGAGHFERGTLAFERGDYSEAAAEFDAAYELTHHADLLYNVYTAQERNGELELAATALEGYLRDGSPEDTRREALELRLERLHSRIAERRANAAQEAARVERERLDADHRLRDEQDEREAAEVRASDEREGRLDQARSGRETADALTTVGIVTLIGAGVGAASFGVFAYTCRRDICRPDDTANQVYCGLFGE